MKSQSSDMGHNDRGVLHLFVPLVTFWKSVVALFYRTLSRICLPHLLLLQLVISYISCEPNPQAAPTCKLQLWVVHAGGKAVKAENPLSCRKWRRYTPYRLNTRRLSSLMLLLNTSLIPCFRVRQKKLLLFTQTEEHISKDMILSVLSVLNQPW